MSSQTKFLISMLFIVVIILCAVLTRFYFDVSKNTGSSSRNSRVEAITHTFGEIQVFRSEDGGVGLLNADLSVLIEPDWLDVLDVTDKLILVTDRLDNRVLTGGIDYEENIILPFVFRSMEKTENNIHIGTSKQMDAVLFMIKITSQYFRKVLFPQRIRNIYWY